MSDPNLKGSHADDPAKAGQAKPRRLFRILFGLSLALNLLVIGAIVGAMISGPIGKRGPPGLREVSMPYVGAFERETKREMRREMRARFADRRKARADNQEDYAEFLTLVRSDIFDAERAGDIIDAQLGRAASLQNLGRTLAIEKISAMSREERSAYADRLQGWLENKNRDAKKSDMRKER